MQHYLYYNLQQQFVYLYIIKRKDLLIRIFTYEEELIVNLEVQTLYLN